MPKNKFYISIPLAILITLLAIVYQRTTGPTYPKKVWIKMNGEKVKVPFVRSFGGEKDAPLVIPKLDKDMQAMINFKRFPTDDPWTKKSFLSEEHALKTTLPNQPPAGKIQYYVDIIKQGQVIQTIGSKEDPIFIRFKGEVPTFILAPHIFFMFISMLFSSLAAVEAFFKTKTFRKIGFITLGSLTIGGLILGPIVQKYAFGVYWAGFPFDWDLTDNKLLISVIAWTLAVLFNLNSKKLRPAAYILAGFVLIGMYTIPHSTMGSQYDYSKNKVITDK